MNRRVCGVLLGLAILCALSVPSIAAESSVTLDQLIANHLKSIGTPEALAAAKARQLDGTVHFEVVVNGGGKLDGKAALVCDGPKMKMGMLFDDSSYPGEVFTTDGEKVSAKSMKTGMRSLVGGFIYDHSQLMREGLIGGVLSSAWPLLDLKDHKAKLSLDGIKKVNDRELYEVTYRPKKNSGDASIKLYFDENFHHVMSVYRVTIQPQLAMTVDNNPSAPVRASEEANAGQTPTRYMLEEDFSNFKQENGLTLPAEYTLRMTYEPGTTPGMHEAGDRTSSIGLTSAMNMNKPGTTIWKYDMTLNNFVNAPVPSRVFTIQ